LFCIEKTQNQDGRVSRKSIGRVYKEEAEGGRKTSLILTDLLEPEYKVGIAKITFANEELLEMG
jgi:hypothetical protein